MIIDTCIFFNEIELLKIRLAELYDTVDAFVIAESCCSHSGAEKPYFLKRLMAKEEMAKYAMKVHVLETNTGLGANPWIREHLQRNALSNYPFRPDDTIIFSDLDEIPNARAVKEFAGMNLNCIAGLVTNNYRFKVNLYEGAGHNIRAFSGAFLQAHKSNFQEIRCTEPTMFIGPASWHFTYLGTPLQLITKLQSFAHCNDDFIQDMIEALNKTGECKYGKQTPVVIDDTYPKAITENLDYYKELGWIL